jgi:hypothetical protein
MLPVSSYKFPVFAFKKSFVITLNYSLKTGNQQLVTGNQLRYLSFFIKLQLV